jgi:hypothetical protein
MRWIAKVVFMTRLVSGGMLSFPARRLYVFVGPFSRDSFELPPTDEFSSIR